MKRLAAAAVAATAAAVLTSCGGPDAAGDASLPRTAPGADLSVGEPAVLDLAFLDDADPSPVQLTVDGVRQGTGGELDDLELGSLADGWVPLYVDVTVRRLGGEGELAVGTLESGLQVAVTSGEPLLTSVEDDHAPCRGTSPPDPFEVRSSYTSCVLVVAEAGEEVTSVSYAAPGTPYADDPVVWTP